jgi:hypothetical protein
VSARPRLAAVVVLLGAALSCAGADDVAMPRCEGDRRLAIVAQSVVGAAYVPCVAELPPGWTFGSFEVERGRTRWSLRSDRAAEPVRVELTSQCDIAGTIPIAPRAEGAHTHQRLSSIDPYAGELVDVFPGGCVTARFDFERGPHLALMDELQRALGLFSRQQLRRDVRRQLGVELDP